MTKHSIARFGVGGLGKLKWALEWSNEQETIQACDIKYSVRSGQPWLRIVFSTSHKNESLKRKIICL